MLRNLKGILKLPSFVYVFWFAHFLAGLDFVGAVLIPFFTDWGHLNYTQIQTLQSWFMFWAFVLEVPTGALGDKLGVKFSTILGILLSAAGFIIYVISPHFRVFMLAEFIIALGFAFISGADVAWLYELLDQAKARQHFRLVHVVYDNAYVFGMLVSAPLTGLAVRIFSLRWVFALQSVSFVLAALLLAFLTSSPRVSARESLTPRYVDFIKQGARLLAKSKQLRFLVVYLIPLKVAGYFVIWLYQGVLANLKVPIEAFGLYRAYLLAIQLVVSGIILWLFRQIKAPRYLKVLLLSFPILIMISYVSLAIAPGIITILLFLTFAGGIGLRISTIMSKEINELIPSKIRATALSFIGMLRRVVLTVLNPVVGASVDHFGFSPVLLGLGTMMMVPVGVGALLPGLIFSCRKRRGEGEGE